uniref:Zinc metalloproteinase n=1 Tax=Strongyloides venezuelensis TaxID=75913 RepID=A0A0K0FTJ4_STRVS
MTKSTILISLLFFCFTIVSSLFSGDENIPAQDRNNFEITKKAMEIIEQVEEKMEEKNSNYTMKTYYKGNQDDISDIDNNNNTVVKPMENPYLLEGDEVLTRQQAEDVLEKVVQEARNYEVDLTSLFNENTRFKRKIQKNLTYTWEFPINYISLGADTELIDKALGSMQNETCIRFKKHTTIPHGQPGLKFVKGTGCWSYVGRTEENKFQDVSIGYGCTSFGTVQHETMHALGSTHEQSRADRDQYLTILEENMLPKLLYNYEKLNVSNALTYNTKYDYGSDMQYPGNSFSKNDLDTMAPKNYIFNKTLGIDDGLSFLDVKLVNFHYCSKNFTKKIKCYNGGYEDPNNNTRCKCVEGYDGDKCIQLPKPKQGCNTTLYHVTETLQTLALDGAKNCLYHLKARHGKKINITVTSINIAPSYSNHCLKDNSLEVKFIGDKTPTGALLCKEIKNLKISSDNDHAIVHYRSAYDMNKMEITFSTV